MQWTADNTPSTIQSKSLKLRELFAKVANASLDKGFSQEESIFAGTNAVKIEERKNQPAKVKPPKLPSHIESLRSYTNPFEVVSKAETELPSPTSDIKTAEFDKDGRLVLSLSNGKKITSKNTVQNNIEQNIAIAPNVQLLSSDETVNITQNGQAFDLSAPASGSVNLTSNDNSIVITGTSGTYDLAVSAASPASTLVVQVRNQTGATLTKGTVVYINGASGNKPLVSKALATSDATSAQTLGLVTSNIITNQNGYVTIIGIVSGLDTSAFAEGTQLYLSPTVAGTYTATKPHAPSHLVYVGVVTRSHQNQGTIEVKVQNGYELDEIHDVQIVNPTDGQIIAYDAATDLWKNVNPPSGGTSSVTSVAGKTGAVTLVKADVGLSNADNTADSAKSVASAAILTNARLINGVSFNGSENITIADSTKQPLDADLTAIAALTGTSGLLKKTAADTWILDTSTYVTSSGVTSVGGTGTISGLTLTGSVTSTGNLTLGGQLEVLPSDFQSQSANLVLASPNAASGKPTFRSLVASDIPTLNQNTTGTSSNVTGTVSPTNGGTGLTTYAAGDILYASATNTLSKLGIGSVGDVLKVNASGVPAWGTDISGGGGSSTSIYDAEYNLSGVSTNATETELFVDGVSNSRISVPLNKTVYYTAEIVCRRTDASGDHAAFSIKGVATNLSGTVSDVGLIYELSVAKTDASFAVDIRSDNTNDTINVYVTGNTDKTVSWKCAITILEV